MTDKYDLSGIDSLPAAPAAPASAKYDLGAIDAIPEATGFDKSAALFTAAFGNPSEEAQKRRLSSDITRIVGAYEPVLDVKEGMRRHQQLEADHATRASPRTSAFLSVPENAAVAIQDAKTMAQIEKLWNTPGRIVGGRGVADFTGDAALGLAVGGVSLGEAAVGIADIGTFNAVGNVLGYLGYDPKGVKDFIKSYQSPQLQAADEAVQKADGFGATLQAVYDNPMSALGTVIESGALTASGAAAARYVAMRALAAGGAEVGSAAATKILQDPMVIRRMLLAASISEGALTAGSIQEQARQGGRDWSQSVLPALGGGTLTALISRGTSMIPGLRDAEVTAAAAGLGATSKIPLATFASAGAKSLFKEGVLEEMPQSAQEQIATNIAMGKPWDEGVGSAAAMGLVAGMGQAGGMHTYTGVREGVSLALAHREEAQRTKQLQETLTGLMDQAKNVKSDPVTFQNFMAGVTDNATVFINADALQDTLAQNKMDVSVLPSLAEQLAQPSVTGDVEVPIGELMTAFAGTPAQEQVVQHARVRQDDLSAAEQAQFGDMGAFFKKQGEAVMEKQKANESFVSERQEIEAEIVQQLGAASPFQEREHRYYAQMMGAFYSTAADLMGTTPKQIQARWAPKILGATEAAQPGTLTQGFDHGNAMLNVGLDVGATDRAQKIDADFVKAEIEKMGVQVLSAEQVEGEYEYEGKPVKELTYVPHLSRPLTEAEVNQLAIATGQEAIGHYADGTGNLWGPNAANWGDFNPEFFKDQKGVSLAAAQSALRQNRQPQHKAVDVWGKTFREWFGKSKVIDDRGRPLRVYHGTAADVAAFDPSRAGSNYPSTGGQEGLYFTDDSVIAGVYAEQAGYAEDGGEQITPVYLSLQNPLVRQTSGSSPDKYFDYNRTKILAAAKKAGADGIIVQGADRALYIAFKGEQVKSAISNTGDFDPTNPNILEQSMSSRRPTAKKNPEDHLGEIPLTIDYNKIEPDKTEQNMKLVSQYPGIRFKARKADGRAEEFIQHVTNNLLWLHDQIPAEIRQRSKLWYDGARAITDRWSAKYGKTDAQIAAILAVYSPQKDWFMNVSLAERTLDIVANQQDTAWSPEMTEVADKILADEKFSMLRGAIEGKKLAELKDRLEQAAWLRTFDEAHNNRGHRLVTPEGGFIEFATSTKNVEKKTGWPGFGTIIKALYVIDDGSPKMIDNALGGEHKVRSFYNNIFHPTSDQGFVTIDTHAVAAGLLRPLSGSSVEVAHNFGGAGTATSAATGMSGTYAYYQEAYRRAAEARGLLPREMQSITWEAVRELYTMSFKHDTAKMAVVDKLWSEYEKGKRDLDSVRAGILNLAGGVEQPSWVGRDSGISPEGWASTYTGELLGDSVPRRDTGVEPGAGERATAGAARSELAQLNRNVGAVAGPVVGIHYSKAPRASLASSAWGTGMRGAEGDYVRAAADKRLRHRITFYVNTGNGIKPESDVGTHAHAATLRNLYDVDADALKIWKNNQDERARESAVLDAGFDGYLSRNFGTQGAVVMLGERSQNVEYLGNYAGSAWTLPKDLKDKAVAAAQAVHEEKAGGTSREDMRASGKVVQVNSLQDLDSTYPEAQAAALSELLKGFGQPHDTKTVAGFLKGRTGSEALKVVLAEQSAQKAVAARAEVAPSAEIPKMKQAAMAIMQNRALPNGRQSVASWKRDLERSDPDTAALIAWDKIPAGDYYKDQIAGQLWQTTFKPVDTESAEFKRWFGDSKVVDADGKPLRVFHGTKADIEAFSPEAIGSNFGLDKAGFFFTNTARKAKRFAGLDPIGLPPAEGGNVLPVYVSLKNPLTLDRYFWMYSTNAAYELDDKGISVIDLFDDNRKNIIAIAEEDGHDGVLFEHNGEMLVVPFKPTQIKSAISNTGEFSDTNPSILFAEAAGPRRGSFNPLTFDLRLLADANRSTFIHEASHFFMAAYIDMASQPDAPPQLKEFVENLLGYLFEKVPGGTQVGGKGLGQAAEDQAEAIYREMATDEEVVAALETYMVVGDPPEGALNDKVLAYMRRLPQVPVDSYLTFYRNQPSWGKPWSRGWASWTTNEDQTRFFGGRDFEVLKRKGGRGINLTRLGEVRSELTGEFHQYGSQAEWLLLNESVGLFQEVGAGGTAPGAIPEGRTNLERWNAMTLDQQRAYWEFFAEGWEQYAMSGKAPTKALQSAFSAFAKWMKEIYTTLKNFVTMHGTKPLDAELTQYFDRMLATDEELEAARAERGFQTLFKNLAESGMSPGQFADYMALDALQKTEAEELLRSRSIRDMKWLSNAKSKAIKEIQAEADELRNLVRAGVEEELANTPIRQAERWLRKGEMVQDGEQIVATAGFKLDSDIVKTLFPQGAIDSVDLSRLKQMMASTGTQHPDDVAKLFDGFRNGEHLVRELLAMPAFKDEVSHLTDLRMLEEHGDLATPEAIEKAADEAIHNDAHLKMVATEVWALTNRTGSVAMLTKAAKAFASNLVDNTVVKKLSPVQFVNAATRAGKAAVRAMAKKDTDKAASEKRVEMVNAAAAKEAYAAEAEVRAIMTRLRKISAYSDKHSSITSREFGVVQAVRAILAEFDIGQHGEKATKYLKTLSEYDPTLGAVLDDVIEQLAPEAKPWPELKVADLRELHAAVTGLWRVAKEVRSVELAGEKMSLDDARAQLIAKLEETGAKNRQSKAFSLTDAEIRNQDFQSYAAKAIRPENWVSMKDGLDEYGPWRRLIWNTIDRAQLDYNADKGEKLKQLKALLVPIMADMTDIQIDAPELGGAFGAGSVIGYSELLHAILHTGNTSNKTKLLVGRGWGSLREDGSVDSTRWDTFMKRMWAEGKITKTHMDFVQGVWDLLESMKEGAQKAHRATTGRYFEEIEAAEIVTPFGVYRGGYAPAIVDRRQVADMDIRKLQEAAEMDVVHSFDKPAGGFTKSRVQNYNQKLELNIAALGRHIDQVLLFSHMSGPVRNVQRVLKGKDLSNALAEADRAAMAHVLAPWLHSAATQTVTEKGKLSYENMALFTKLRSRAGMALMFANVSNSLQQLTSFFPAMLEVGKKDLLFAAAKGWYRPREMAASIAAMSPYMKQRLDNEVHAMAEEIDQILLNPTKFEKAQDWAVAHSYFLQMAVDTVMSPIIWQAKFNEATARGAEKQEAIDLADAVVRKSQGSNRAIDIAAMEKGSPFYRMFMQFAGYFNSQINLIGEKLAREKLMPKTPAKYARIGMILAQGWWAPAITSMAIALAMRGGPDDEDGDGLWDDWLTELLLGTIKYATAAVPVFGQAINATVNAFNDKPYDDRMSLSPAVGLIDASIRGGQAAVKSLEDPTKAGRAVRDLGSFLSLFGVPVTPVTKAVGYATDVQTGKVSPTSGADYARGIVTGVASPESKQ